MKYNKYVSSLLYLMQDKYDNSENEYQMKILKRIIALLEEYVN